MDAVKWAESLTNSINMGFNMARQINPQPNYANTNPVEMLKTFGEFYRGSIEDRLARVVADLTPEPSIFEKLLQDQGFFDSMKTLLGGVD